VDSNVKNHMILLHSVYWDYKYVGIERMYSEKSCHCG
jgi:hypothetical protein